MHCPDESFAFEEQQEWPPEASPYKLCVAWISSGVASASALSILGEGLLPGP